MQYVEGLSGETDRRSRVSALAAEVSWIMRVSQHSGEKDPESLKDRCWNFVPAAEPVPFNRKAGLAQCVAKSLRSHVGQDLVLHSMALEDRQAFALRHEGIPDWLR